MRCTVDVCVVVGTITISHPTIRSMSFNIDHSQACPEQRRQVTNQNQKPKLGSQSNSVIIHGGVLRVSWRRRPPLPCVYLSSSFPSEGPPTGNLHTYYIHVSFMHLCSLESRVWKHRTHSPIQKLGVDKSRQRGYSPRWQPNMHPKRNTSYSVNHTCYTFSTFCFMGILCLRVLDYDRLHECAYSPSQLVLPELDTRKRIVRARKLSYRFSVNNWRTRPTQSWSPGLSKQTLFWQGFFRAL